MKMLLPTTIEGWNAKKRRFMTLLEKEQPWTYMAYVYRHAVNYCDKKVRQIRQTNCKLFLIGLLACLILSLGGCQTAKGMMGDAGWLFQTGADNIQTEK